MNLKSIEKHPQPEQLLKLIRQKTSNLFVTGQLMCSEVVLTVLNRSLKGDLPQEMAVRLASGLPEGLGGGGCLCGALNSGVLALGLFLGRNTPGVRNNRRVLKHARSLHDGFRERFGIACCRTLIKHVQRGSKAHYDRCAEQTGWIAERTAGLILEQRPDLIHSADWRYLVQQDSRVGAVIKRLSGTLKG